jgi:hypothetical protein
MKAMRFFSKKTFRLSAAAALLLAYAGYEILFTEQTQIKKVSVSKEHFEVSPQMNAPLTFSYTYESEGAIEEVADSHIINDCANVLENMELIELTSSKFLKRQITEDGFKDFEVRYMELITACNKCNRQVEKGFVIITKLASSAFDNPDFSKNEYSETFQE